jgi:hypothetical protein
MITQSPRRELTLNFPIDKIKKSIAEITRLPQFILRDKNELFGTYKVAIVRGFKVGIMNITLNAVDENKSQCVFEMFNAVGGNTSPASFSLLQDDFLQYLANHLEGKTVIKSK